jgi:hypothetical protein
MKTHARSGVARAGALALLGALAVVPSYGCGSLYADRCDAVCQCEGCSDRDRTECDIQVDAEVAVAGAYDCVELLDLYYECQLQEYECNDGRYRDDNQRCSREREEYAECKEARSSREGGPY